MSHIGLGFDKVYVILHHYNRNFLGLLCSYNIPFWSQSTGLVTHKSLRVLVLENKLLCHLHEIIKGKKNPKITTTQKPKKPTKPTKQTQQQTTPQKNPKQKQPSKKPQPHIIKSKEQCKQLRFSLYYLCLQLNHLLAGPRWLSKGSWCFLHGTFPCLFKLYPLVYLQPHFDLLWALNTFLLLLESCCHCTEIAFRRESFKNWTVFTADAHICHSPKPGQIHFTNSSVLPEILQNRDLLQKIFSRVCIQHKHLANRQSIMVHGPLQMQHQTRAAEWLLETNEERKNNILQVLLLWWNDKEKTKGYWLVCSTASLKTESKTSGELIY